MHTYIRTYTIWNLYAESKTPARAHNTGTSAAWSRPGGWPRATARESRYFWIPFQYLHRRVSTRPPLCAWPLPASFAPGDSLNMLPDRHMQTFHDVTLENRQNTVHTHTHAVYCEKNASPMARSWPCATTPPSRRCQPLCGCRNQNITTSPQQEHLFESICMHMQCQMPASISSAIKPEQTMFLNKT